MSDTSPIDPKEFYRACNPAMTLNVANPEERKYYIDFSSVRGGKIIEEMRDNISEWSPDDPTCQLFTGHIGYGKSTELLRLKYLLEDVGFHAVYFESSQVLEMSDVDMTDILMAVALQVGESLKETDAEPEAKGLLRSLFEDIVKVLNTEMSVGGKIKIPGLAEISAESGKGMTVSSAFGELTVKTKDSPDLRSRLRQCLEPRTSNFIEAVNKELIEPAIANLKAKGKKGLAVIVDNPDRVESTIKSAGKPQPEYLFVDRGEKLKQLQCHAVPGTFIKCLECGLQSGRTAHRLRRRGIIWRWG